MERRQRAVIDTETGVVATSTSHSFSPTAMLDLPAKVPGRHRWILSTAYTVTDEEARTADEGVRQVLMGTHNIVSYGIGCWDCEKVYSVAVTEACGVMGGAS